MGARKTLTLRRRIGARLLALAALCFLAAPAAAQAQAFYGETFTGTAYGGCDGPGFLFFQARGTATGPYPGIFSEFGSANGVNPLTRIGTVRASFSVRDATGAVIASGTKTVTGVVTCGLTSSSFAGTGTYTTTTPSDTGPTQVTVTSIRPGIPGAFTETFGPPQSASGCDSNGNGNGNDQCQQ